MKRVSLFDINIRVQKKSKINLNSENDEFNYPDPSNFVLANTLRNTQEIRNSVSMKPHYKH